MKILVIHCGTSFRNQLIDYLNNKDVIIIELNFDSITSRLKEKIDEGKNTRIEMDNYLGKFGNYDGVIYAGGTIRESLVPGIYRKIKSWSMNFIRELRNPFLGICLGHMMLGFAYGSTYKVMEKRLDNPIKEEKGIVDIYFHRKFPLLPNKRYLKVYEDHERELSRLPNCLINTASSINCAVQAIYHTDLLKYGVQFHPEVAGIEGKIILDNFIKLLRKV
jgi:GMP synthase-like glutamine amidotransferase